MARRTKELADTYRIPTYHAPSNRWRFRLNHGHGTKDWYWPAIGQTTTPPPKVIAAAVAIQDQFRQLVNDWAGIRQVMDITQPDRDWSRPVFLTADAITAAKATAQKTLDAEQLEHETHATRSVAAMGLDRLMALLGQQGSTALPHGDGVNKFLDRERLSMLEALRPAAQRLDPATIRQAMATYLAYHDTRTTLKAGDFIEDTTFSQMRKTLLAAFGLSSSPEMRPVRNDVPLALDVPLATLEDAALDGFARFWHAMPDGVNSTRTVRNRLHAARHFFKWCAQPRRNYGFQFGEDLAKIYTAQTVQTPAVPYDVEQIKRILRQGKSRGGQRLRLYVLLGLLCGYTQVDCAEISGTTTTGLTST